MSIRDISASNIAALSASPVRAIVFFRLDFATTPLLAHTEIGPRTATHPIYGSESYEGVGDIGGLSSSVVESISQAAQAVQFALTGIDAAIVGDALDSSEYHRRDIDIMLGLDDANGVLIDDPVVLWSGYMDKADITLEQRKATVVMTCESRASIGLQASQKRFTDEQLQSEYSGDLGGQYIYRMVDIQLPWGSGNATSGGYSGGSRWAPSSS